MFWVDMDVDISFVHHTHTRTFVLRVTCKKPCRKCSVVIRIYKIDRLAPMIPLVSMIDKIKVFCTHACILCDLERFLFY